jgi:hypothetical protein
MKVKMIKEQHENIVRVLEHIRKRPGMYFSSEVPTVVTFLDGFKTACVILDPELDFDALFKHVILNRGWEHGAQAVWSQMRERGFSEEAVVDEMIAIYTAVWEKIAIQADQPSL